MPKNIPALKPKQLIKILEKAGCNFYREGKGDHCLYIAEFSVSFVSLWFNAEKNYLGDRALAYYNI